MKRKEELTRRDFLRLVGAAGGLAGATVLLPGCAGTATPGPSAVEQVAAGMVDTSAFKKDPPWVVGRAGGGDVNAWMVMFTLHYHYGIEEKYKDKFKEYYETGANFEDQKQINDVEDLLTKNLDLLFIDPGSEAALVNSVEMAMDQGVPVILGSTKVLTDRYVSWVTTDNQRIGFMGADWLGKRLNGKGNVILLMGMPGGSYAEDWLRGSRQALAQYPDIKEVGMAYCYWSPTEAKTAVEGFIQANPQIDGVVPGGGLMGIGAVDAFIDAGRPVPPMGGTDDDNAWLRKAKESGCEYFAVSGGADMSLTCVDLAVDVLSGNPVPKLVIHPVETFDQTQTDKYFKPDLNDQYWAINRLPEEWITKYYSG
jgi:ribose transport system substrate-binding protein